MTERDVLASKPPIVVSILRVAVPLAALAALFAGGAWVYTHLVGSILYQAQSAQTLPTKLILALAVLAGAASFFSPCSLVITPAFLTYFVEKDTCEGRAPNRRRLLSAALLIAGGIVSISAVAGLLLGAVGAIVYNFLVYMIPLVGLLFLALGVMILVGRGASLAWASRYLPGHRAYERMLNESSGNSPSELFLFGVAYGAASHSCTLPVVIGMLLLPLAAGSYWLAGTALVIYGIALAGLMLLMLMLGQPAVTAMRRTIGPYLQYVIGVLFLGTGAYLLHYFMLNYGLAFAL